MGEEVILRLFCSEELSVVVSVASGVEVVEEFLFLSKSKTPTTAKIKTKIPIPANFKKDELDRIFFSIL